MKSLRVLLPSTHMFCDPCPGTHKYLEAHYQCVSAAHASTTTNRHEHGAESGAEQAELFRSVGDDAGDNRSGRRYQLAVVSQQERQAVNDDLAISDAANGKRGPGQVERPEDDEDFSKEEDFFQRERESGEGGSVCYGSNVLDVSADDGVQLVLERDARGRSERAAVPGDHQVVVRSNGVVDGGTADALAARAAADRRNLVLVPAGSDPVQEFVAELSGGARQPAGVVAAVDRKRFVAGDEQQGALWWRCAGRTQNNPDRVAADAL